MFGHRFSDVLFLDQYFIFQLAVADGVEGQQSSH